MHRKKQQGEESVSLLPILGRRTKAENARLFFEVLVSLEQLKTKLEND